MVEVAERSPSIEAWTAGNTTVPSARTLLGVEPDYPFEELSAPESLDRLRLGKFTASSLHPIEHWRSAVGTAVPQALSVEQAFGLIHPGTHFGRLWTIRAIGSPLTPGSFRIVGLEPEPEEGSESSTPEAAGGSSAASLDRLQQLLEWTDLSPAELSPLLGASRRSVYNWLAQGAIGARPATRIARLHTLLEPLANTRDPLLVRAWLTEGAPSPAEMASEGHWEQLQQRVTEDLRPLEAIEAPLAPSSVDVAYPEAARRAALLSLANAPRRAVEPRAGWHARELTGITSEIEDHDERGS